jgi:cephalosporin hydroxylase
MTPGTEKTLGQIAVERHYAGQDPWELDMLLAVVQRIVKPGLILEIGSDRGGSLYAWASIGADVVAVTLAESRDFLEDGHTYGAAMIYGNSHDDEMRDRILGVLAGRVPDMAFIDGDHSYAGCAADLELCASLGIPVIAFHDVSSEGDPGVRQVWDECCETWPHVLIGAALDRPVGAGIVWLT